MQVFGMNERESFAEKLKFLRKVYGLSAADLAYILSLKSRTSVSNMEAGRALPSYELLAAVSNLFAGKMDWLAGRTDEAYDEVIISKLEKQLLDIKIAENTLFMDIVPQIYLDNSSRQIAFSLLQRASLVFALQFFKTVTEKHPELLHQSVDTAFMQSMSKRKCNFGKWSKKPDERYMQLLRCIAVMFYKSSLN